MTPREALRCFASFTSLPGTPQNAPTHRQLFRGVIHFPFRGPTEPTGSGNSPSMKNVVDTQCWTYAELRASGFSRRQIEASLQAEHMRRICRNRYARPTLDANVATAVAERGRLACVSLLKLLGVFVHTITHTHVHILPGTSHFLSPCGADVKRHWLPLQHPEDASLSTVSVTDAVLQAAACLPLFDVVATLDSVVRKRLMSLGQLHSLGDALPARARRMLRFVNGIADSGPETYVRLILLELGVKFQQQVEICGVGRVDFLIEGWLILEVDSFAHHSSWHERKRDLRRDLSAAEQGYTSLRVLGEDAMYSRSELRAQLRTAISSLRETRAVQPAG